MASTSGLHSRLRSASPAHLDDYRRPGTDPALGFASFRIAGTLPCIRSGSTPFEITRLGITSLRRSAASRGQHLLSARGLRAKPYPARMIQRAARRTPLPAEQFFSSANSNFDRRPFSVLMGLMPRRSDRFFADRIGFLSEVPHRP